VARDEEEEKWKKNMKKEKKKRKLMLDSRIVPWNKNEFFFLFSILFQICF